MANIKSQIKRNRQNEANRARNKGVRSRLRTLTKRVIDGDEAERDDAYRAAVKAYDQAAAHGVIHRSKAANAKSRLAKRLND